MIATLIIACEIGFWIFLLSGLSVRYLWKMPKTSACLLICTPLTDIVLLVATVLDLRHGASATFMHGLAAIYLGASVVYGHKIVKWADRQFEYRFTGGERPTKRTTYGSEKAREERSGWYQHLLAWMIGSTILCSMILMIDGLQGLAQALPLVNTDARESTIDLPATSALANTFKTWTIVLAIDFAISFSYTIFPKQAPKQSNHVS